MAILTSRVVAKNSGAAFKVEKGQRLRIAGKSIVDFVAFNPRETAVGARFKEATVVRESAAVDSQRSLDHLAFRRSDPE